MMIVIVRVTVIVTVLSIRDRDTSVLDHSNCKDKSHPTGVAWKTDIVWVYGARHARDGTDAPRPGASACG